MTDCATSTSCANASALNRKLELISRTVATLLEVVQNKRSLRVEWYIVLLILFEIVLTLYDMFFA